MGFVQQVWVGQIRGKMPPTFLLAAVGAASCPWERRPAAIQSQSRLEGAPTRRYALSQCHYF